MLASAYMLITREQNRKAWKQYNATQIPLYGWLLLKCESLSEKQIKGKKYFKANVVKNLITKVKNRSLLGEIDEIAIAGILSVQL